MAKNILIDVSRSGVLVAQVSGTGARGKILEHSFKAIGEGAAENIEQAIYQATSELSINKGQATLVLSREFAELRTLPVPRVDAAELPGIVRFQAQRKFANLNDNCAVDYVILPDSPGKEMHTALVSALAGEDLTGLEKACQSVGLQVSQILLRSLEIARFSKDLPGFAQASTGSSGAMIVCRTNNSLDLLTVVNGQTVQVRGTVMSHEANSQAVSGEIRRSLLAGSSELQGISIENTLVISGQNLSKDELDAIGKATGGNLLTQSTHDLVADSSDAGQRLSLEHANRIAGLIGANSVSSEDKSKVLDFKHTKKAPPKKTNKRAMLLGAAAAVLLVVGGFSWVTMTMNSLDAQLKAYRAEAAELEPSVEIAEAKAAEWRSIEAFLDGSPNWLDELKYITDRMPPSDQIVMLNPTFSVLRDGTAQIRIPALRATSSEAITKFEEALRDENHIVRSTQIQQLPDAKEYPWQATETILISGSGWKPTERQRLEETPAKDPVETEAANLPADAESPEPTEPTNEKGEQEQPSDANSAELTQAEQNDGSTSAGPETDLPKASKPEGKVDASRQAGENGDNAQAPSEKDSQQPPSPVAPANVSESAK